MAACGGKNGCDPLWMNTGLVFFRQGPATQAKRTLCLCAISTCAKPSRGYITERKVQARGATAKKPVTRYDAPYTTEDGKPLGITASSITSDA